VVGYRAEGAGGLQLVDEVSKVEVLDSPDAVHGRELVAMLGMASVEDHSQVDDPGIDAEWMKLDLTVALPKPCEPAKEVLFRISSAVLRLDHGQIKIGGSSYAWMHLSDPVPGVETAAELRPIVEAVRT
jgi:hypothetical protein